MQPATALSRLSVLNTHCTLSCSTHTPPHTQHPEIFKNLPCKIKSPGMYFSVLQKMPTFKLVEIVYDYQCFVRVFVTAKFLRSHLLDSPGTETDKLYVYNHAITQLTHTYSTHTRTHTLLGQTFPGVVNWKLVFSSFSSPGNTTSI
jgi:hypothetical protein